MAVLAVYLLNNTSWFEAKLNTIKKAISKVNSLLSLRQTVAAYCQNRSLRNTSTEPNYCCARDGCTGVADPAIVTCIQLEILHSETRSCSSQIKGRSTRNRFVGLKWNLCLLLVCELRVPENLFAAFFEPLISGSFVNTFYKQQHQSHVSHTDSNF